MPTSRLPSDEEIERLRMAGEFICKCKDPQPDVIGQCVQCGMIVFVRDQ